MENKVALIANGELDLSTCADKLRSFSNVIAVDGGISHCKQLQIYPRYIIGDLDSANADLLCEYPLAEKIQFPQEKDESDLELAILFALKQGFHPLTVFGGLGHRTDHTFYNLQLITRFKETISFDNGKEQVFALSSPQEILCRPGQTLSFFSLDPTTSGVCSRGLKWELQNISMKLGFMSLSNVALQDKVHISFESGHLICSMYSLS